MAHLRYARPKPLRGLRREGRAAFMNGARPCGLNAVLSMGALDLATLGIKPRLGFDLMAIRLLYVTALPRLGAGSVVMTITPTRIKRHRARGVREKKPASGLPPTHWIYMHSGTIEYLRALSEVRSTLSESDQLRSPSPCRDAGLNAIVRLEG